MTLVIDIHALQSVPPSLINRDDTGAPKSATFGGVPRQRVSSQAWKRAVRTYFKENFDPSSVGYRTRRVVQLVADEIVKIGGDEWQDNSLKLAEEAFKTAKIKLTEAKDKKADEDLKVQAVESTYLLFLSPRQIHNLAQAIVDADGKKLDKKTVSVLLDSEHSVDIAMFGRMVADDPAFNVDAAVQVAHALGVHESEPEFDFFTAVDDRVVEAEETGAGMMGTVQMMSSTLYRFATVNVEQLAENLGDMDAAVKAAGEFVKAFIESMPTGKQNTFANNTLPELVYVAVRDTRSVSLVNAFEEPVVADGVSGRRKLAAEKLAYEAREIEEQYGFKPLHSFVIGLGDLRAPFVELAEEVSLPSLPERVASALQR